MEYPETTVVCDLGSGTFTIAASVPSPDPFSTALAKENAVYSLVGSLKVGFPGHMYPRSIVRSVVEKSSPQQSDAPKGPPKWVYKPVIEANYQQGCVENDGYENPCVNGIVSNWDAMQVLLEHTFNQLEVRSLPATSLYREMA